MSDIYTGQAVISALETNDGKLVIFADSTDKKINLKDVEIKPGADGNLTFVITFRQAKKTS